VPWWVRDLSKQNVCFSRCSVSFLAAPLSADEQCGTEMNIAVARQQRGDRLVGRSFCADVLVPDGGIAANEIGEKRDALG
jgi:hypothetical protein